MVDPDFSPTQAREEAFSLVGAGLAIRVGLLVVDALGQVARVKVIPMGRFVRVDRGADVDALRDFRNTIGL